MLAVQAPALACMTCVCAHVCVPDPGPIDPVIWTCFLICPRVLCSDSLCSFVSQHPWVISLEISVVI